MEACAALQASLSEVKNDDDEVEAGAAAVNLRDAVNNLNDEVLQNIVNNYVDNVVVPTYRNLKEKNAELLAAVNAFVANPSNEGFMHAAELGWKPANRGKRAKPSSSVLSPLLVSTPTWTPGLLTKTQS